MDIDLNLEAGAPNTITSSTTFDAGTQFRASFTYTPDFVATAASNNIISFSAMTDTQLSFSTDVTTNAIDFTALTLVSAPSETSKLLPTDRHRHLDFIQGQLRALENLRLDFRLMGCL